MTNRLVLASKSSRRYEFLKQLGLDFDVIPSKVAEDFTQGESPKEYVIRLAEAKALDVGDRYPDRWVIAADTAVYVNGVTLGKPKNTDEAVDMLLRLSGKEHSVITGFSVLHSRNGRRDRRAVETMVKVKPLTVDEMRWYVRTGEPFDKAGGYAIQGIGSFMIESIRGSYTNVVGLPMCEVIEMLLRLGALTISECGLRIAE